MGGTGVLSNDVLDVFIGKVVHLRGVTGHRRRPVARRFGDVCVLVERLIKEGVDRLVKVFSPLKVWFVDKLDKEDKIPEGAPPGKEKGVKALKKKWPDNLKRVYATAWWQYNQEKGKND